MKKLSTLLMVACSVLLALGLSVSAEAASAKILYQSPPEGITLNADKKIAELPLLTVSSYSSIRVVAHVRASSVGTNKVDVSVSNKDLFLYPNAAVEPLVFPLWNKALSVDGSTTSLIDRPGIKITGKLEVNAGSGEQYITDVVIYGFK